MNKTLADPLNGEAVQIGYANVQYPKKKMITTVNKLSELKRDVKQHYITKAVILENWDIIIYLSDWKQKKIPKNYTKRLAKSTIESLHNFRLLPDGIWIHFPEINEDICVDMI